MQSIRSVNTKTELILADALRKRKISYRRNLKTVIGKPDFVFQKSKVAVFVDSDFWHGHPSRFIMPKTNMSYWRRKIQGNRHRDKLVNRTLKQLGWRVLRIWERSIKVNQENQIEKILILLNAKKTARNKSTKRSSNA